MIQPPDAPLGDGVALGESLEGGGDEAVDVEGGRGGRALDDPPLDLARDPEPDAGHPGHEDDQAAEEESLRQAQAQPPYLPFSLVVTTIAAG